MSGHVAGQPHTSAGPVPGLSDSVREITGYWWLGLVAGIAWIAISVVILQFDSASVTTVGVLVGLLFMLSAAQNFTVAFVADGAMRWASALFGVLFVAAGVICFIDPEGTFTALADILGFLFLLVGIWWMVRAFMEQAVNPLWWLGLISGVLMTVMAFWTAGQFLFEKAYILLVFAGVWALMEGITSITRAFAVRRLREAV
jgi:uncharacterized membrane protein HdeD (DUF308 family)